MKRRRFCFLANVMGLGVSVEFEDILSPKRLTWVRPPQGVGYIAAEMGDCENEYEQKDHDNYAVVR